MASEKSLYAAPEGIEGLSESESELATTVRQGLVLNNATVPLHLISLNGLE